MPKKLKIMTRAIRNKDPYTKQKRKRIKKE